MTHILFILLIHVRLRPSEACALQWNDIDWEEGKMRVRGTKTVGADSTIPMTPFSITELGKFHTANGRPERGPCFTWKNRQIQTFHQTLQRTCLKVGLADGRRVHSNMLRHTFATLAAYYGVPLPVAQQILRHSSPKMLLGVYAKAGRFSTATGLDNFPL